MAHKEPRYEMTLRLPPELAEQLKDVADISHRSLNAEIIHALEQHIASQKKEVQEVDGSGGKVVSS